MASGGAVSVFNPIAGGAITSLSNIGTDAFNPNFQFPTTPLGTLGYFGKTALDGLSAGSAGKLATGIVNTASGWFWKSSLRAVGTQTGTNSTGILLPTAELVATKTPLPVFNSILAFKNAISPFKGELTHAGRAVTKHPEYFGFRTVEELQKVYKGTDALNKLGLERVKDVLRNGNMTLGAGGRHPNGWVTFTLPNGNAASWSWKGILIGFRGL